MPYQGYAPDGGTVDIVPASIGATEMWRRYIQPRRPVVLNGLLDDAAWHGDKWTDLAYLRETAGDATVLVEPVHPKENRFGTATPRETMKFSTFLDTLVDPTKKGKFYLTTQYELEEPAPVEDEDDGPGLDPVLPSPTHKLKNDFPLHPRVLGNLVLQQCNLWVGSSQEPKSSGLHHDFHDNLYMLLSGYKRFVLFPPSAYPFLHIRGEIADVHPNGLLVYGEAGCVRPDGLHELDAAHWRLAARAQRLAPQTKRARNEKNNDAFTAYKKARDELTTLRQRYNTNEEEQDEDEDDGPPLFDGASEAGSNFSATDGEDLLASLGETPPEEPPSFSHIMPHTLHTHFGIAPAIPEPEEANKGVKPETNCPRPLIVELKPGQMLYLPASWFHEVTSSSSGENPHMALNYWMHPPDGIASTYADNEIWDHIRCRVERETDNS